jgi:DNA-binding transcriptional ArsR family regulator
MGRQRPCIARSASRRLRRATPFRVACRAVGPSLIAALKAITDPTRLRICGALVARPCTLAELADALGLRQVDIARHVERLRAADLLEERPGPRGLRFSLRRERLAEIGHALDALEHAEDVAFDTGLPDPLAAGGAGSAEDRRILAAFFEDGRLTHIPATGRKRLVVLRYLARTVFPEDREYPEKEVNQLLALRHPDVAALRRYLVDEGFMRRDAGRYRLRAEPEWPPASGSS